MKNQTEALEHASVKQYCKAVRVPTVGANFISLAEQAVKENQSHIRYLEALLAIECEERDHAQPCVFLPQFFAKLSRMSPTSSSILQVNRIGGLAIPQGR